MSRKIIGVTVGTPMKPQKILSQIDLSNYATKEDLKNIKVVLSWNDLTGKPFYSEAGEEVDLLPSQELTFTQGGEGEPYVATLNDFHLEENKVYKVTFDNVEYELTCKRFVIEEYGMNILYIGNGASIGVEDTGEPFGVMENVNDNLVMVVTAEETPTHTIRIYQGGEVIHKLDMKYIDTDAIKDIVNDVITDALNSEV